MSKIGIIDCDALYYKIQYPNECCMNTSTYYKNLGHEVELIIKEKFNTDEYDIILAYGNMIPDFIKPSDKIFINHAVPSQNKLDVDLYNEYAKRIKNAHYVPHFRGYMYVYSDFYKPKQLNYRKKVICVLDKEFFKNPNWRLNLRKLDKSQRKILFKEPIRLSDLDDIMLKQLLDKKKKYQFTFKLDQREYKLLHKLTRRDNMQLTLSVGDTIVDLENAFDMIYDIAQVNLTTRIQLSPCYKISHWYKLYEEFAKWSETRTCLSFYEYVSHHSMQEDVRHLYKCRHHIYVEHGYPKGKIWKLMDEFLLRFPTMKPYFVRLKPLLFK